MKGIAITNSEDVSALEIEELIREKSKKEKNIVIFNATPKKLCDLCYFGRSFSRIMELVCFFEFKNLDEIEKKLKIGKFSAESFAARCIRKGNHDFSSSEVEKIIGNAVDLKVDLKNPQKILLAYVNENKFYLGIEYSGVDLGKRDYKIFNNPASIRGDVAYCLLRIAGFGKKDTLLDPFCGAGTIPIEASLFCSGRSVHFFNKDKFAFLKFMKYEFKDKISGKCKIFGTDISQNAAISAQKNAKIAGVEVNFSKADVEWLDTKFGEHSFDKIITNPPSLSHKEGENAINELFRNAGFALKPKGAMAIITQKPEKLKEIADKNNFKLKKEISVRDHFILVFNQ